MAFDWRPYITVEPDRRGGQPTIRGQRIAVKDVLEYLASGMSVEAVVRDFPELGREDVLAAIAFAADHLGRPSDSSRIIELLAASPRPRAAPR